MLIESPITFVAACVTVSAVLNLAIMKVSPNIGSRLRHVFAGGAPTLSSLGAMIALNDSVVASGTDLIVLGTSIAGGLAAAAGATRFVTPKRKLPNG